MRVIAGLLIFFLISVFPAASAKAKSNKITPVISDEEFESNFIKGAQESVTLGNGRIVNLHNDFTWSYAQPKAAAEEGEAAAPASVPTGPEPKTATGAVEVWDTTFDEAEVDSSKAVRLFLHYKNNSSKRVVGVAVTVSIFNSFGKRLYLFSKDDEVAVEPHEQMKNESFFVWKDNPYIQDEPYDLMWEAAQNGTGKIKVQVRKVVFEDGTVLTNETNKKKTK